MTLSPTSRCSRDPPRWKKRPSDLPISKLCFDEERLENNREDDLHDTDMPSVADVSSLRHGFGKMDMDDDSIIVHTSFSESSPIKSSPDSLSLPSMDQDESGLDLCSVNFTPSPQLPCFREPSSSFPMTPAPSKPNSRTKRVISQEAPRTPMKEQRFRSRTSLPVDGQMKLFLHPEEQYNINPFSAEEESVSEPVHLEDRKRPAAAMLSTPDINRGISSPESGYGSRHKYPRASEVVFSVGSPGDVKMEGSPTSRYEADFVELETIGSGHFGRVTKVRKRLDGVIYAIKRTQDEVQKNNINELVTEVFALSALESHHNILRYFSSWVENGHLYIQSEFCDAGTLRSQINSHLLLENTFDEDEIRRISAQTASGLRFLHEHMLVHLDVKPDNILICNRRRVTSGPDGRTTPVEEDHGRFVYKIGDLGHVRSFRNGPIKNYMDGDRRYLAPELLRDMQSSLIHAPKADVYSLGVTLFETASASRLKRTSKDWLEVALRNAIIPGIPHLHLALNQLFQRMTARDPECRPEMHEVVSDPAVHVKIQPETVSFTRPLKGIRIDKGCRLNGSVKHRPTLLGRNIKTRSISTQF